MPLVDFNDPALWDGGPQSLYRSYIDGVAVGFVRAAKDHHFHGNLPEMMTALEAKGLVKGNKIVIVGAAFGWSSEALLDMGYGPIANSTTASRLCNVDTSTWIHANKTANAVQPIVNLSLATSMGRQNIKRQFGGPNTVIDWAISEDVLPALSDAEVTTFCNNMRLLATKSVHWVSVYKGPGQDQRLNWKTLEEWKALVTPDYVIERGKSEVL